MDKPSVHTVVDALGGTKAVSEITKNAVSAVSNWRKDGKFPANTYVIIKAELKKRGKTAPDSLWSMKSAEVTS